MRGQNAVLECCSWRRVQLNSDLKKSRITKRSCRANNLQEHEDDINEIDTDAATPDADQTSSSLLTAFITSNSVHHY
jgi:hypothetical protein